MIIKNEQSRDVITIYHGLESNKEIKLNGLGGGEQLIKVFLIIRFF